jgi:hypothetical protein
MTVNVVVLVKHGEADLVIVLPSYRCGVKTRQVVNELRNAADFEPDIDSVRAFYDVELSD